MKTPKLTWSDYKDSDGNWVSRVMPADHIRSLWARGVDLERELAAAEMAGDALEASLNEAKERIAALEADRDAWRPIVEAVRLFASGWEHAYDCPIALNVARPCDCGREQLLVAVDALMTTEEDA